MKQLIIDYRIIDSFFPLNSYNNIYYKNPPYLINIGNNYCKRKHCFLR